MALERDYDMPSSGSTVPPQGSTLHDPATINPSGTNTVYDRDTTVYDRDRGGSNFLAFLIGGLVIAMGLLAFLFYDGGSTGRDVSTTSSTTPRIEAPASPSAPATPTSPSRPSPAQ
jgi:hypothetical protein